MCYYLNVQFQGQRVKPLLVFFQTSSFNSPSIFGSFSILIPCLMLSHLCKRSDVSVRVVAVVVLCRNQDINKGIYIATPDLLACEGEQR
jgi:hypothetical protein